MEAKNIYIEMQITYKDNTPDQSTIYKWLKKIQGWRKTFEDVPRTGRPINSKYNAAILKILEEQLFPSARYISDRLSIPKSTVCYKLIWQLNYKNLIFN